MNYNINKMDYNKFHFNYCIHDENPKTCRECNDKSTVKNTVSVVIQNKVYRCTKCNQEQSHYCYNNDSDYRSQNCSRLTSPQQIAYVKNNPIQVHCISVHPIQIQAIPIHPLQVGRIVVTQPHGVHFF